MIQWLIENLLPWSIVDEDEIGIFLRRGKYVKSLTAGVYFTIPCWDSVRTVTKTLQTFNLEDQYITVDDKAILLSVCITYSVENARKALMEVEDYEAQIGNATMERMVERKADTEQVFAEISDEAEHWGVAVHSVVITNKAPCQVVRVVNNVPVMPEK